MKTPKRDYFAYAEHDMYTTPGTANKLSTRWKRKNRVKQLKRTIQRLTYENRIFKETFMQNRAFLKELLAICKRLNSSTLHRLTDVYQQLSMQLMSLKNYDRKEMEK
jgi:hypothetical protein